MKLSIDSSLFQTPTGECHKAYAKKLDKKLGFKINQIEQELLSEYRAFYKKPDMGNKKKHFYGTETWVGLDPQVLLTPYQEIFNFLSLFESNPPDRIVDLGAAYGRVALVAHSLFPDCEFVGYEIIQKRVKEASRIFAKFEIEKAEILEENILLDNFSLPDSDIYFIYDFSDPADLKQILNLLSKKMEKRSFYLVAKGKGVRSMILHKFPEFYSMYQPIVRKNWSIYRSP